MKVHSMPKAFRTPAAIAVGVPSVVELTTHAVSVPTIGLPIGKPKASVEKANAKANESLGAGCAESFLNCVKSQAVSLKVYLQQIADADQHFRKAFRVALDKHREAMREHVKALKGQPEYAVYKAAFDSAKPRISEAIGFSKAVDAGFVPDMGQGYHAIIGASVAFRNSTSSAATDAGKDGAQAVGPTKRRGRQAKPLLDKVKTYLLGLNATASDFGQIAEMALTLQKLAQAKEQPASL